MSDSIYTEKLFSYGTLQYTSVQLATFQRKLEGNPDVLSGYNLTTVAIKDDKVVKISGDAAHPIITFTGSKTDQVAGLVFAISSEELQQADMYEVANYKRINVQLHSGINAWVYVNAEENL